MKTRILTLSKPQKQTLLNHYAVGGGILALRSADDHVTTIQVAVDRSGVLREIGRSVPLFPLHVLKHTGVSALPYNITIPDGVSLEEARTQALAICRSANRHLAEIEAVMVYRHEAVRVVLQREAMGWCFRLLLGGDAVYFMVVAPEGLSWMLARDGSGYWMPDPEQQCEAFERTWGGSLREAWTQRVLDAAVLVVTGMYRGDVMRG